MGRSQIFTETQLQRNHYGGLDNKVQCSALVTRPPACHGQHCSKDGSMQVHHTCSGIQHDFCGE